MHRATFNVKSISGRNSEKLRYNVFSPMQINANTPAFIDASCSHWQHLKNTTKPARNVRTKPNSLLLMDFNLLKIYSYLCQRRILIHSPFEADKFNFQMYNAGAEPEKSGEPTPYYNPQPENQNMPNAPELYPSIQPGQPSYPEKPMQPYVPAPMQQQPSMRSTNTTVVIQQQPTAIVVQGPRDWSTGICSCFDDCGVCK